MTRVERKLFYSSPYYGHSNVSFYLLVEKENPKWAKEENFFCEEGRILNQIVVVEREVRFLIYPQLPMEQGKMRELSSSDQTGKFLG